MDKTAALASEILLGIGGQANIARLRKLHNPRAEINDDGLLDIAGLKKLPGVSGYVKQGQQHQLIVSWAGGTASSGCHARAAAKQRADYLKMILRRIRLKPKRVIRLR